MDHMTHTECEVKAENAYPLNGDCIGVEASRDYTKAVESLEKGHMQYG